jgi:hypothetical protein
VALDPDRLPPLPAPRAAAAWVALALPRLIGLATNLFYYQRWSSALVSPAEHALGAGAAVLVPVIGCLIIGLLARAGRSAPRGRSS